MTHEAGIEAALATRNDVFGVPYTEAIEREDVAEIIQAYLSASGMVLVPKEPTDFIASNLYAYGVPHGDIEEAYKILIGSVPDPFRNKP